jgi:phosphoglycolate phosphatase
MCQTGQMSATDPSRLVLWDIDHTLIETGGVGRELYRRAFETTTGRPIEQEAEVTGRTEAAILAETLRLHGLEPSAEYEKKYATALAQEYEDHIDQMRERGRALPGAREALDQLAREPGVVQSVLSGNFKAVAMTNGPAWSLSPRSMPPLATARRSIRPTPCSLATVHKTSGPRTRAARK